MTKKIGATPAPTGYVDRGMVMSAYPTADQVECAENMQPSLICAWNWMTSRVELALEARDARAVKEGLMPKPFPASELSRNDSFGS